MTVLALTEFARDIRLVNVFVVNNGSIAELKPASGTAGLHYSPDQLAAIDSRLPCAVEEALRESSRVTNKSETDQLICTYLYNTVMYWTQAQTIRLHNGEVQAYEKMVIDDIDMRSDCPVRVDATVYAERNVYLANGKTVVVAPRSIQRTMIVCLTWLEEKFPGSLQRIEIANALGITAQERSDYVLGSHVSYLDDLVDGLSFPD